MLVRIVKMRFQEDKIAAFLANFEENKDKIKEELADVFAYAFLIAEDERGEALGFQAIGPRKTLPPEACDIATFTRSGKAQLGIGSALFSATEKKAKALGYHWINATILNQNTGGQAYYQSRGFEPYKHTSERVFMRFPLH